MPLRLVPENTKYKFVAKRYLCLAISMIIIFGTAALVATKGLNMGIDFTGGALIEFRTEQKADIDALRKGLDNASIQTAGDDNTLIVRVPLETNDSEEQAKVVNEFKNHIAEVAGGKVDFRKVDYVGPQAGAELIHKAIFALIGAFGAIMVYVWFRFEWQYGVGGLLAIIHDAIALIGFYAITQIEFNLTSVAALLTVVGYSINDSVVIYDRVRENIRKFKKMKLADLIDLSVNDTLSRTLMTSITTLIALISLIIWGGEVLASFAWGTLFGILIGTYSSIYVSAIILMVFKPNRTIENKTPSTANIREELVND